MINEMCLLILFWILVLECLEMLKVFYDHRLPVSPLLGAKNNNNNNKTPTTGQPHKCLHIILCCPIPTKRSFISNLTLTHTPSIAFGRDVVNQCLDFDLKPVLYWANI